MRDSLVRAGGALVLGCAAWLGTITSAAHAADALATVPVADFFKHPTMADAELSPSGRQLGALVVGPNERRMLAVIDLDGKAPPKVVGAFADADVRWFTWINENRLVYGAIDMRAGSGNQLGGGGGLYAVNADGSAYRRLIRRRGDVVREGGRIDSRMLEWNHSLLRTMPGTDDIIVKRWDFNEVGDFFGSGLLRMNTVTGISGRITLGAPSRGADGWVVDGQGRPRAVSTFVDGVARVHWRETPEGDSWTVLSETPWQDAKFQPIALDDQDRLLVLARRDDAARTNALFRYDPRTKQRDSEPLVALAGFDFGGSIRTRAGRLLGAHFTTDADGSVWFDPALRTVQERVDKHLPATANRLMCGSRCDTEARHVLVRAASDRQPGIYYLYDRKSDSLELVGAERPWIDAKRMAERSFERIAARDGLEIPAYVTRPRGKGPFPAVVLVHGGPYVRGGNWEWSDEAQFLASRGYLVIEPEFRGSRGFGDRHFRAGFKQWGLAMQDDLADAALWAVKQGLADRSRIAIAGASYGGYAALMGLVRHPELYRGAISWVGVTDIGLMYSLVQSDASGDELRWGLPLLVGDREKDAAQLAATSPLKQATRITQPVLLAYGGNDVRVPIEHGTRMRDALAPHNKKVEWVEYPDEGHGFLLVKTQVDFWTRVERFLARELGAPNATVAPGS